MEFDEKADVIEFTDRWLSRLYAAQKDLIDAYGGCKRVVDKLNVSKSQVGRWYGGVDRDVIPTPVVMTMEGDCRRPIVTAVMAEFSRRELSGDAAPGAGMACLSTLAAELVEVTGRMMVETVRARADGMVTPNEAMPIRELSRRAERIRSEIDDVLAGAAAGEGLRVVPGGK